MSPDRQAKTLIPNHRWDFQAAGSVASQRGGTTGTFSRTSAASRITTNSTFVAVASSAAAISLVLEGGNGDASDVETMDTTGADFGLVFGEAVTYEGLRSTALDNAAWAVVGTPIVTADQLADMFGVTTAELLEDDAAGTAEGVAQTLTIPDDTSTWTASVWLECVTPHDVALKLVIGANTTQINGDCSGTWQKFSVQTANPGGTTTAVMTLFPAGATASTVGQTFMSYAQLYNESFVTSREVVTAAAAVSTTEDDLTYTAVAPGDTGTLCAWVWRNDEGAQQELFQWDGTANVLFTINNGGAGQVGFDTTNLADTSKTQTSTTVASNTWTHVCWAYDAGVGSNVYLNGAVAAYADAPDVYTVAGDYGTTFTMGPTSADAGDFYISRVKLWTPRVLTAGQIASLYRREANFYQ